MITAKPCERGAAIIEFAMLLLLLLIMLFGIAEYGFLWLQTHYVESSAREGARVGARIATLNIPPTSIQNLESEVRPAVEGAVRASLSGLYGDRVDTLLSGIAIEGPGSAPLPALRVNVSVNSAAYFPPIVWPLLNLIPGNDGRRGTETLSSSAAFAIEPH